MHIIRVCEFNETTDTWELYEKILKSNLSAREVVPISCNRSGGNRKAVDTNITLSLMLIFT